MGGQPHKMSALGRHIFIVWRTGIVSREREARRRPKRGHLVVTAGLFYRSVSTGYTLSVWLRRERVLVCLFAAARLSIVVRGSSLCL